MVDVSELMTITDAARYLKVSRTAIYKAIERGSFHPVEAAGRRFLLKQEVMDYAPYGYEGKRPSKNKAANSEQE